MMIQVEETRHDGGSRSFELSTEKKAISVFFGSGYITVCVKNASHRVWRGLGRTFHAETIGQALQDAHNSYKDSAVKAMLEHLIESEAVAK